MANDLLSIAGWYFLPNVQLPVLHSSMDADLPLLACDRLPSIHALHNLHPRWRS
jgi:hypothetical protein